MDMLLIERFRKWYEYERDCNAKTMTMLRSVPKPNRKKPEFERAVGKMAHLVMARRNWLCRLGVIREEPGDRFPAWTFDELPSKLDAIETSWTRYLASLTEQDLERDFAWTPADGRRRQWRIADLLTQTFGHAWYHRGQIAMLVKDLGGSAIDTDYIFWDPLLVIEEPPPPPSSKDAGI